MKRTGYRGGCNALVQALLCVIFLMCLWSNNVQAQFIPAAKGATPEMTVTKPGPKIRDLKLLEEYSDGRGNIVRKVQYTSGIMKVTETIIMPKPIGIGIKVPINPDTIRKDFVTITVDKSKYCVSVSYRSRVIRSYKAVFGPRPQDDKLMEGDRATPEGWFTIQNLNPRSQYNKFMLLSYPNDSAKARFTRLQASGVIPKGARIGGSVGIHGIWPGGDDMIEMGVGWTDGCVALRNKDVDDLFAFVGVGTKVCIRK